MVVPKRVTSNAVISVVLKIWVMILQVRIIKLVYVAMSIPPKHQRKIKFPLAVQRDIHAVLIRVVRSLVIVPVVNRSVVRVCAAMIKLILVSSNREVLTQKEISSERQVFVWEK